MVQYRKVKDRIKRFVRVWKIRDVTFHNSYLIAIPRESGARSVDHLRIEVDRSNASCAEILDLSGNTFARSTSNVEDLEPLGTSTQRNELRDHAPPQSFRSQSTIDVEGLCPIHPHPRSLRLLRASDPMA